MAYLRPQTLVYQERATLPGANVRELNAFIYGPHYALFRYSDSSEKAQIGLGAYNKDAETAYGYPGRPANAPADLSYVKLFGENVWLKYFAATNPSVNPLVMSEGILRNKIKAASRIVDGGSVSSGPTYEVGGFYSGQIGLPEAYYLVPQDTFDLGTAAGVMEFVTTEGFTGEAVIPADATQPNVKVQGPGGLVFDFDNPGDVLSPRVFRFQDSAATSYFTVALTPSYLKEIIDEAVPTAGATPLNLNVSTGTLAITWTAATRDLEVVFDDTAITGTTLTDLRAAILAELAGDITGASARVTVSAVTGTGTNVTNDVVDQDANAVTGATNPFVPDAIKVNVYPNSYVWRTANGVNRSAQLYRDVMVGDRLYWRTTPSGGGGEISGYTTVKNLIPDYTLPVISPAVSSNSNKPTLTGSSLTAGLAVVENGTDISRPSDLDTTLTVVKSQAGETYMIEDMAAPVLTEQLILTVTKSGDKGTAEMSVENASGSYVRYYVPVEDAGTQDGRVYVGKGLYVDFKKAATDFLVGDQYLVGPIDSQFTTVAAPTASGSYMGTADTTYRIEIARGGRFTRTVDTVAGIKSPVVLTLTASLTGWVGGDINDEYILKCVAAGNATTSVWELESQSGDTDSGIVFPGVGASNALTVGSKGLSLYLVGSVSDLVSEDDYFIVRVWASRPLAVVTDALGLDQETSIIIADNDDFAVGGYGVMAVFASNPNGGLVTGDVYTIDVEASKATATRTIELSDTLPDTIVGGLNADGTANQIPDYIHVELMLKENFVQFQKENRNPLVAPGNYNWLPDASGVTVYEDIAMTSPQWVDNSGGMPYLPVDSARLFLEYRALLQDYADSIYGMTDISEVTELGVNDPDNPLGYGMYLALQNNQGVTVYFSACPTDDVAGDAIVLNRASLTDIPYGMAVMSPDRERIEFLLANVESMSSPEKKQWRMMAFGMDPLVNKPAVDYTTHPLGAVWQATVTDDSRAAGTQYTKVTFSEDADLLANVKIGDTVRLNFTTDAWGNEVHTERIVGEIVSNTVLYVTEGLTAEISTPRKTEVWHLYSTAESAEAEKALSESFHDYRAVRVFPGRLGSSGVFCGAHFGAAIVVSMIGAVVPQQGLTNATVLGLDDLPDIYGRYNAEQLDTIASGGTLIFAQDLRGSQIYIRHQLTTMYVEGDPDVSEIMSVKNLDSVSYFLAALIKPFIGKYNATNDVAAIISITLEQALNYLGGATGTNRLLGPQVILDNGLTQVRNVQVHPTLRDRILAIVDVQRPYSLNVIELHIVS